MGVVYAARDVQLEREVALKLLHPQVGGKEATIRLMREARAMARLSHPNVAQIYDVGEHDGRVFVTMELIVGQTLRAWQDGPDHDWRAVVEMYIQAGQGLQAAHRAGLVHRDFKPENALVGDDGRLRVLDFGLAALTGESLVRPRAATSDIEMYTQDNQRLTDTGVHVGTPGYAAPELRQGVSASPLADQYSFCVALFEALHKTRPTPDIGPLRARGSRPQVTPRGRIPGRVHAAVVRGLQPDPAQRWPALRDLLGELERGLRQNRRRWLASGVGAIGLCIAAALGWSKYGRDLAQSEEKIRAQQRQIELQKAKTKEVDAEAKREAARATAARLASLARTRGEGDPTLGLLLAVEAVVVSAHSLGAPLPESEQALRDALDTVRSVPLGGSGSGLTHVAVAPAGDLVAASSREGPIYWWQLAAGKIVAHGSFKLDVGVHATGVTVTSEREVVATLSDGQLGIWTVSNHAGKNAGQVFAPKLGPQVLETPLKHPQTLPSESGASLKIIAHTSSLPVLIDLQRPADVVPLKGDDGDIRFIRVSPDGRFVAVARKTNVELWNTSQIKLHHQLKFDDGTDVRDLDFNPTNSLLMVAFADGSVQLWPTNGGRAQILDTQQPDLRLGRFTSGGYVFVTVSADQRARAWEYDPRHSQPLQAATLRELGTTLGRLTYAPSSNLVAGTPPAGELYLWSLAERGAPTVLRGHAGTVVASAFAASGDILVTASTDRTARWWRWHHRNVLHAHRSAVHQVAFVGSGNALLTTGFDGSARLWPRTNAADVGGTVLASSREDATVIGRECPQHDCFVTVATDGSLSIWSGSGVRRSQLRPVAGEPTDLALHEGLVAVGTGSGTIDVRGVDTSGSEQWAEVMKTQAPVTCVEFTKDGRLLVASERGDVTAWRVEKQRLVRGTVFPGTPEPVYDLAVAPGQKYVASAYKSGEVRVWSLRTGELHAVYRGHEGPVWSVEFDQTGKYLVTGSSDTTARVWALDSPDTAKHILRGHRATVWRAVFSPDATQVATGSADGSARLWTLASGTSVKLPHRGTAPPGDPHHDVTDVEFHPSGQEIATAAGDGVVRVFATGWQALVEDACTRAGRRLSREEWSAAFGNDLAYAPACPVN